jgi:hypothetical protein
MKAESSIGGDAMQTWWKIALALGALALAGGIGFYVLNPPAGNRDKNSAPVDKTPPLQIEEAPATFTTEFGFEGYHDFRFENRRENPVTVGVELKDCLCARVQICLTPDKGRRESKLDTTWETLEQEGQGFLVPAQAQGMLRLAWKGKKVGDQRYWGQLWIDDQGRRLYQRIEVSAQVVLPVLVCAEDQPEREVVDIGTLSAGEERTARFVCYSETRQHFTVSPAPPQANACFEYGVPQSLTDAELAALSKKIRTTIRSGYRVTVSVRERADKTLLDIGPFRRPVAWSTDVAQGHKVLGTISGRVQGEVKLAEPAGKTFVALGKIAANDPAPVLFRLESNDPQLELAVDDKATLEFLTVELLDGKEGKPIPGGKSWRVRVLFRKDATFRGQFPVRERPGYDSDAACSIVFHVLRRGQTVGFDSKFVRRLLVPVHGVVPAS